MRDCKNAKTFSGFEVVYPNYEITREADEKVKTYLDTFGRPVLVFSAKNLEENHIKNIEVRKGRLNLANYFCPSVKRNLSDK